MLITVCVWTLLCPWAYGQSGEASAPSLLSSPWKFGLAPYLWLPAMQGEITVRGHTVDVDLDLEDTLDLVFDSLKFAFMGRAEAHKGPLLFTLDLLYLDLEGDQTTTRGLRAELTTQLLITEFGAGYRLGTFALGPVVYPYLALDFLAGGRYVFLETDLDFTGGRFGRAADVERDVDWIEPFVGGRVTLRFSHRAALIVRGDAGGFGVGSDLTWSLVGTFQYYLSRAVSLDVGYRVLDIDYDQGSGANLFRFDVRMHGPRSARSSVSKEVARHRVAQRPSNLPHTHPQHAIGDMRARPHVLLHLGLGHQTAGMRHEIAQHGQGPRPQGDPLVAPPQAPLRRLQPERPEGELVLGGHRAARGRNLNRIETLPWHRTLQFERCGSGVKRIG